KGRGKEPVGHGGRDRVIALRSPFREVRMGYKSVFRPDLFQGQVIIVTGGGSGIGRCTAHELTSLGATVAIVGRNPEKLASVQAEVEAEGGKLTTHVCDIREEAKVVETIGAVLAAHG